MDAPNQTSKIKIILNSKYSTVWSDPNRKDNISFSLTFLIWWQSQYILLQDSIHGDLDVETQRKILDSLSPHTDQEPGPSHRATGHHQSSPVKRRPCVYFLSGFCRNGLSCPDYHGLDFDPCELEDIQEPDDVMYIHIMSTLTVSVCENDVFLLAQKFKKNKQCGISVLVACVLIVRSSF